MVRAFQQMLEGFTLFTAFVTALLLSFNCGRKMKKTTATPSKNAVVPSSSQPNAPDKKEQEKETKLETPEPNKDAKPTPAANQPPASLPQGTEQGKSTPSGVGGKQTSETLEEVEAGGNKKKKRNSYVNLDLQLSENGEEKSNDKTQTKDNKTAAAAGVTK